MSEAVFVSPCVYPGTSFERLSDSVQIVIDEQQLPIDVMRNDAVANMLPPDRLDDAAYVQSQLETIGTLMTSETYSRYLFVDFFNPGLDLLRYRAEQQGRPYAAAALLHGATFMTGDLYTKPWQSKAEQLWGTLYDRIYVPSACALDQLPKDIQDKAQVYPWGLDSFMRARPSGTLHHERDIDVLFPHRLSEDKGLDDLVAIARELPDIHFVATSPSPVMSDEAQKALRASPNIELAVCPRNEDAYALFGRSVMVLSCAYQELFGYSVAEAYVSGCVPVLPNRQVYPELYGSEYLYESNQQCVAMIEQTLRGDRKRSEPDPQALKAIQSLSMRPLLEDFLTIPAEAP